MPPPACRHGHPYPANLAHNNRGHAFCRACARTYHHAHPLPWTPIQPDPMAIQRAISGDPPAHLTPRERQEVVTTLTNRGRTARQIAEHAHCTPRTVYRIRSRQTKAA